MITLKQEPIFTLCLNGAEYPGFKVESEWEGFKKLQHIAADQYVIVATDKACGTFAEAIDTMFAGFLKRAPEAAYYPIACTPGLNKLFVQPDPASDAARELIAERKRQVIAEGYSRTDDDNRHKGGQLATAAACYAANAGGASLADGVPSHWPWDEDGWNPSTPRRDLVKAGALILAEIERLDRAAAAAKGVQS